MRHFLLTVLVAYLTALQGHCQITYTAANVHSHNDYAQANPFFGAYNLQCGAIEADVYLKDGELMVAHNPDEIKPERTLHALYLQPLAAQHREGKMYPMQLLIDLKTPAAPALATLVDLLNRLPYVFGDNKPVKVVISGNMPSPNDFGKYPSWISFDGRFEETYSEAALARVPLFSAPFSAVSRWNGLGIFPKEDREKLVDLVNRAHQKGKKVRFWGAPDNEAVWKELMAVGVDWIGSDNPQALMNYFKSSKSADSQYTNSAPAYIPYQPTYKSDGQNKTPKNIILLIGDGMGLAQMHTGLIANHGQLHMALFKYLGLMQTQPAETFITDSAAAGTAIATGYKTKNGIIGMDATLVSRPSIAFAAKQKGKKCAIISSGPITDATPAVFYAHQPKRSMQEEIAMDFLKEPMDILAGGGTKYFFDRKDKANLGDSLKARQFGVIRTYAEISNPNKAERFVVLDDQAGISFEKGRGNFLPLTVKESMNHFQKTAAKGFFIMAEGAQIDYAGHANNTEYVVNEVLDFDRAVGEALRFADQDGQTLVIVTADHETGGMSVTGGNEATGMANGNFASKGHSAIMVPVYAYGPQSQQFGGIYQNTELSNRIRRLIEASK
ncbi:alkaline phosphatase [Runella sp.]|uniref:alkaline phosphatase n=1 Tax=Runella sp. TaxID=1960881 RepID=UPI003D0AB0BA